MISKAKGGALIHGFDLVGYRRSHPIIQTLLDEDEPEIHGTKVWDSSWLIMDYLERKGLPENAQVVDAGCGWGLTGIYCARRWGAFVSAFDADECVFPFLDLHADTNEVEIATRVARFGEMKQKDFRGVDLLVGADICFWEDLTEELFGMIERAVKAGVPRILIADPGRGPFDDLAELCRRDFKARVTRREIKRPRVAGELLVIQGKK